mmetsp:Transcript_9689/g.21853  ORF Transcript_9689/g.21853 Transcript_9689/m.21853 type:complete len:1018 (-) Transcript_9689:104-3157(-)|eukprot:CAMPEP_0172301140 /NCGR_PEP_ID=MMETSP1058-20130122/3088_1 /TAXON_ID=83371 /ORGANISM="Detonula confervacea, Strain CCMP 353" /LENGTH=1017 /DNA_ID=CAMNT_0013011157 /DNA_START=317 /DNA_END=3370 /DNA_ORIENTATION=-
MYRMISLLQKQSKNKDTIRPIHPIKSDQQTLGMRKDVHAFLTSKSAISSLSFSSAGGDYVDEIEEKKGGNHLSKLEELSKNNTAPSIESKDLELSTSPTAFKVSKTCEGRLVARIVPKKYSGYCHKPFAQTDPAPLVTSFLSWQMQNERDTESGRTVNDLDQELQQKDHLPLSDEESVVILDLYLFRSAFLDQQQPTKKSCNGREGNNFNRTFHQQREKRIHSLMSSFDVNRNNTSHKRDILKSCRLDTHPTEDMSINEARDVVSTVSTASSFTNGKCDRNYDCVSNNLFRLHMNRSSTELATRTLRRLELSTTRKLQSLNPLPYREEFSSSNASKRVNRGKEENMAMIHKSTSSKLVLVEDLAVDEASTGYRRCREVDLSKWSSADIFSRRDCNWVVALTVPKVILPWNDRDLDDDKTTASEDSIDASSSYSSSATSLFTAVETINIGIISNPPTLLAISTFETFTGYIFTGVPLVIDTTVIHATRAVITWLVGGQVALYDSNMYTPAAADIGKRMSILVTPIRPGHNGDGCQEAYSFCNAVKALPIMPIMELRDEWCRRGRYEALASDAGGESGMSIVTRNNLRVVTYNILADLYAGREIENHLMYGHCDVQDLVRQRRMPMIIAEILSYNADIICLQEVDAAIHDALLRPVLEANGYQGFYSNKVSSQQEGCSMFWSTAIFEMVNDDDMRTFPLRSLLAPEQAHRSCRLSKQTSHYFDAKSNVKDLELERWESVNEIRHLFEIHDEVRKIFRESVGQIVQIVRLSPKKTQGCAPMPKSIVVANTHLFYHPMADHIRVLQAYAICHKLDEIRREGQYPDPVLICGDFNSGPLSGAVRLLTNRSVLPNENDCWKHLNVYRWECGDSEYMIDHGYICNNSSPGEIVDPCYIDEEFVDAHSDEASLGDSSISNENASSHETNNTICPPAIELPSSFPILASGCLKVPQFTNYAVDFVETLDYVFASKPSDSEPFGFRPKGEAPMLTTDMVKKFVAMPNEVMPSDHEAVACDFEWVKNG